MLSWTRCRQRDHVNARGRREKRRRGDLVWTDPSASRTTVQLRMRWGLPQSSRSGLDPPLHFLFSQHAVRMCHRRKRRGGNYGSSKNFLRWRAFYECFVTSSARQTRGCRTLSFRYIDRRRLGGQRSSGCRGRWGQGELRILAPKQSICKSADALARTRRNRHRGGLDYLIGRRNVQGLASWRVDAINN